MFQTRLLFLHDTHGHVTLNCKAAAVISGGNNPVAEN